ncbi:MAG TPA: hypothetical protein ENJ08_10690 [Gammaproteobacteria bacterium]|nr:hypothetical protein [Gammaproteobacteria bacterium]
MTVHNDIEKFIELSPVTYRFLKSINVVRDISGTGSTNYDVEIVLGKLLENGSVDYLKLFCINAT